MAGSDESKERAGAEGMRRVTVRDIAREAGVSATQVSFALRGVPRVSEQLRARILKVADELGYRPDERMAALSRYRKDSKREPSMVKLAWLNLWDDPAQLHTYREFELYFFGASKAARKLGYQIEEIAARGRKVEELVDELKAREIKGILIAPCSGTEAYMRAFPVDDFTIVRFGLESEIPVLHSVTGDQIVNGELAFERVWALGYRRIGFITGASQKMPFGAGVFWAQKEVPRSEHVPALLFPTTDASEQIGLLAEWMKKARPDAVITSHPHVFDMLKALGYQVPRDVALAATSVHDSGIDAGIDQNPEEIGRVALLTLISLMNEQNPDGRSIQNQTLVSGRWVDGRTLPSKNSLEESEPVPKTSAPEVDEPVVSPSVPERKVTQRDIAKALGVSHVTVSLALRNDPRASAETRARVQAKADELGYVPDPMLSAMGHYCRSVREKPVQAALAWLNLWPDPKRLYAYREFEQYWSGARECARRSGYQLEEFSLRDIPLPRLNQIFKTRNIRGILVPPSPLPAIADMSRFPWRDYVAVKLGVTCPIELPYSVASDDVANSAMALKRIVEKGYRRIAFVGDRALQRTFGAGFYWAQRKLSVQLSEFFLPLKEPTMHRKKLAVWIRKERPDAILTDNSELPEILTGLGFRVPDDIALATMTMYDTPIDAGVDHQSAEIGRMGVVSLIAHMNDHSCIVPEIRSQVHVAGTWVDGSMMPDRN